MFCFRSLCNIIKHDRNLFWNDSLPNWDTESNVFDVRFSLSLWNAFLVRRPHIYVTFNGDFFDFPFIDKRMSAHGMSLYDVSLPVACRCCVENNLNSTSFHSYWAFVRIKKSTEVDSSVIWSVSLAVRSFRKSWRPNVIDCVGCVQVGHARLVPAARLAGPQGPTKN